MNRFSNSRISNMFQSGLRQRGLMFGGLILIGLASFECWNYISTQHALLDILGELKFAGIRAASLLGFAFCAIDFAGIARIFTPEKGHEEPTEVWYLFGAWLLAAIFDATLTYWTVKISILSDPTKSIILAQTPKMVETVSIGIAAIDLIIRVLLINTFAIAGERLFSNAEDPLQPRVPHPAQPTIRPAYTPGSPQRPMPRQTPLSSVAYPLPKQSDYNEHNRSR